MMYIKKLLIVFIIILLAAYSTGFILDMQYKKRWAVLFFEKSDELIKGNKNYDVIFLGNSRVHFGINPYYVDSATKLNSYNFGNGGADAEDIMLTANIYLQKHPAPKLAVISLDKGALLKNEILRSRFHYLFYLENDTISKYMSQAGFLTSLIKVFPFTKYSFLDEYNRTSLFIQGKQYPGFDHNIHKGFINIHQNINTKVAGLYNEKEDRSELSDSAIAFFRNTVSMLQQKGSMVVFVSPPEKRSSATMDASVRMLADSVFNSIEKEFKIPHLHFEKNDLFTDTYFVDDIHLNEPGTRIYSLQLADSIKSIYAGIKKNKTN